MRLTMTANSLILRWFWCHESESINNMKFTASLAHRVLNLTAGLVAIGWATVLSAQTPGKAEVRAIKGSATYTSPGGAPAPLKVGTVLLSGATVRTEAGSVVDIFLGNSAGFVRVTENTTL